MLRALKIAVLSIAVLGLLFPQRANAQRADPSRAEEPLREHPPATPRRADLQRAEDPDPLTQPGARRPNVILVITDDQGYGDLGCHGNTELPTPALDALYADSVRLTDFHVDPTCAPTRAALMTGRYSSRSGVWHTIAGRSIMRQDETTLPQLLGDAGYRTGHFGKWHLGDNFPFRPQDRGFDEVLSHGGGGVGQTPDAWGNDYFDDTYFHNGKPQHYDGYCTDVWFEAALRFIEESRDRPFFAYIATNAPHGPYRVAEKYSRPFRERGIPSPRAEFYGMIANIDENVGRLRRRLDRLGLAENTLLIFMTDNGTAAGIDNRGGFNAGMRGKKGSEYDGGHRVPCFFHWPAGRLTGGRDLTTLAAHIDLLPTLADICGVSLRPTLLLDGRSLAPLLRPADRRRIANRQSQIENPRTLVVHSQRVEHPQKWKTSAVMTDRWRLMNGKELYDIEADPRQTRDVAAEHAAVVAELRDAYEEWWQSISGRFDEYVRIPLGASGADSTTLTGHDWHAPQREVPWNQNLIARDPAMNGWWAVEVARPGRYEFTLRARPAGVAYRFAAGIARVQVGGIERREPIEAGSDAVRLTLDLSAGPARLQTWIEPQEGEPRGAYYVTVRRID